MVPNDFRKVLKEEIDKCTQYQNERKHMRMILDHDPSKRSEAEVEEI